MAKKFKLLIPLTTTGRKGITLVKAEKIPTLQEYLPKEDELLLNLKVQKGRIERELEYNPIVRKLPVDKFNQVEKEIRKLKSNHHFIKKSFDIVNDSDLNTPLVQIVQV